MYSVLTTSYKVELQPTSGHIIMVLIDPSATLRCGHLVLLVSSSLNIEVFDLTAEPSRWNCPPLRPPRSWSPSAHRCIRTIPALGIVGPHSTGGCLQRFLTLLLSCVTSDRKRLLLLCKWPLAMQAECGQWTLRFLDPLVLKGESGSDSYTEPDILPYKSPVSPALALKSQFVEHKTSGTDSASVMETASIALAPSFASALEDCIRSSTMFHAGFWRPDKGTTESVCRPLGSPTRSASRPA